MPHATHHATPSNAGRIERAILIIRGHRVMLDADIARLYGVGTKRLNEAFKRNRNRFPKDFAFQLTREEFVSVRSQPTTIDVQPIVNTEDKTNWSQIATSSRRSQFATSSARHRGSTYRPWAFTEHGVLMAANVLHSQRAMQMSVFIVRAFVRLRDQTAANHAMLKRLAEIDHTLLQHDGALRDLYRKVMPLLQPLPEPPRRRIGFHAEPVGRATVHLSASRGGGGGSRRRAAGPRG